MARRTSFLALVAALTLLGPTAATAGPRVPTWATRGSRTTGPLPAAPAPGPGPGFSISHGDGNDTGGPLDLRSMKISRGRTKDTISLTAIRPVSNADIDPNDGGNFAVLIDVNDNRKFDYGQYVYFYAGKLRGVLVNLATSNVVDRTAPTARVSATTFRTVIQRTKIHSPGTYRFAVFSYFDAAPCSRRDPCSDSIPDTFPLIPLDHKAPSVNVTNLDAYASDASATLTTPVDFTFSDDTFGTGVKTWLVQRREVGASTPWEDVKTGQIQNPTVNVPGDEGVTYQVRVVVVDKQKNKKISKIERTTFALDDRNAAVTYGGATTQGSPAGSFLTTTTSVATAGTVTFAFSGTSSFCVVGGPVSTGQTADVTATLDGNPVSVNLETDATGARARVTCMSGLTIDPHTLVLTVTSAESYVIDGFYV
ncbi:MAG: hypothetical protein ABI572_09385 [Actinomycetota bacterium]